MALRLVPDQEWQSETGSLVGDRAAVLGSYGRLKWSYRLSGGLSRTVAETALTLAGGYWSGHRHGQRWAALTELVMVGDSAKTLELDCLRLQLITSSGSDGNAPVPPPLTP